MTQYPANGVLFQNDRKQNERQPDYTGSLEFDQEVVLDLYNQLQSGTDKPKASLSSWRKTSKTGKPFLSLKASVMRERQQGVQRSYQAPQQNNALDDEIPF
jgi:hypothetical protein